MQEELASLNFQEEQVQNRDQWKRHQPSHLMKMSSQDVKRKKYVQYMSN